MSSKHEQEIAQSVQVNENGTRDLAFGVERHNQSLSAAADGASAMQLGSAEYPAGQNELGERRQLFAEAIDGILE